MLIVADENIPFAKEAFGTLGDVRLVAGRKLDAASVRDADALIVRSVTRVCAELLEGSRVRFVGTATIGYDHVDVEYLRSKGIGFASAAGSNAESVAEWVVAALLVVSARLGRPLEGSLIGVVGAGNVGSRVARKCAAMGMRVLLNDPPLARKTGDRRFSPLDDLMGADYVTLHVPLERGGPDPTWRMFDARRIASMKAGSVLLNSSRGPVVHGRALLEALAAGRLAAAVLDVWEDEPAIDPALARRVAIGTPHIAGYSFDGKVNGTIMMLDAIRNWFGVSVEWDMRAFMPPPKRPVLELRASGKSLEDALREAVRMCYDIESDDRDLRRILDLPDADRAAAFDRLRKEYPVRREFGNTTVRLPGGSPELAARLAGIGFKVEGL